MKKLIALVIVAVMLLGMMPMMAMAASTVDIYLNTGGSTLWNQGGAWFAADYWNSY